MLLKLFIIIFISSAVAQSGTNFWNGAYYNVSVSGPVGWVLNLDTITVYTDWIDYFFNSTVPIQINATYHAAEVGGQLRFVTFNVSLNGWIGNQALQFSYTTAQTPSPLVSTATTGFCTQTSGTDALKLCPFWAPLHFLGGPSSMAFSCHQPPPRCNELFIRWNYMLSSYYTTSTSLMPNYGLIRGNAECTVAASGTLQGQLGDSQTYVSPTSLQLVGIKITANATGMIKRIFFASKTLPAANFWIYADNAGTPVGGALLNGATTVFTGSSGISKTGVIQNSNNYFSMENAFYPTLQLTNTNSYWILGAFSGTNSLIPFVSGGCALLSSFTSTAAIASLQGPPLVGPAGTVSNNCYFMAVQTC